MSIPKAALAGAILACAVIAGCSPDTDIPGVSRAQAQAGSLRDRLPDFSALVEAVGPAVVNISTVGKAQQVQMPFSPGDPMFDLLRRFGMPLPNIPQMPQETQPATGIGSGFIVSADGYVMTNAHVVNEAAQIIVRLTDKRELKARLVGLDKRTDVALLKVEATNLPTVRIGDSNKVRVGEWVIAVGSPFGFANSVTAGIVSAKARQLPDENYVPFIQTDVAINPGNSGGPLFNLNGEVVGINSQIYSRTGGYMGLSFAIPADVAMKVKDQLQKTGRVSRGRLGVGVQPVTRELAESFGLDKPRGALVSLVEKDSAAERAGVAAGDVILAVNGKAIDDTVDLPRLVGELPPGSSVKLSVWRNKAARELTITLGEAKDATAAAAPEPKEESETGALGLSLRALTPQEAQQLGAPSGLAVAAASGIAARAGLQPGDVILAVNNQPVSDAKHFARAVKAAGKQVALLVQRGPARIFVALPTS